MCVWTAGRPPVHVLVLLLVSAALLVDRTGSLGHETAAEFTFLLPAGRTQCFFQTVLKDWTLEVEYQVIAGAGLDVGFTLTAPSGHRVVSDFRSSDGIHAVDGTQDGDYRLCFDNSFSKLAAKMVFFEVVVDAQGLGGRAGDEAARGADDAADSLEGYNMEDIRTSLDSVHRRLETTRHFQKLLRSTEARDRYLLEDNLWRVTFWSGLNLLVMLAVASTQVYTLRQLFQDNRRTST